MRIESRPIHRRVLGVQRYYVRQGIVGKEFQAKAKTMLS